MKNSIIQIVIRLLIFFIIMGCASNEPIVRPPINTTKSYPLADKQLWPFFEKFEVAAKQRGRNINLAKQQIKATIEVIPAPNVGLCNRAADNRIIIIDQQFWASRSELSRELIVFHELGHCSLQLEHRENKIGNYCKSIMRSGHEGCLDNYTASSRPAYLDELFSTFD